MFFEGRKLSSPKISSVRVLYYYLFKKLILFYKILKLNLQILCKKNYI